MTNLGLHFTLPGIDRVGQLYIVLGCGYLDRRDCLILLQLREDRGAYSIVRKRGTSRSLIADTSNVKASFKLRTIMIVRSTMPAELWGEQPGSREAQFHIQTTQPTELSVFHFTYKMLRSWPPRCLANKASMLNGEYVSLPADHSITGVRLRVLRVYTDELWDRAWKEIQVDLLCMVPEARLPQDNNPTGAPPAYPCMN